MSALRWLLFGKNEAHVGASIIGDAAPLAFSARDEHVEGSLHGEKRFEIDVRKQPGDAARPQIEDIDGPGTFRGQYLRVCVGAAQVWEREIEPHVAFFDGCDERRGHVGIGELSLEWKSWNRENGRGGAQHSRRIHYRGYCSAIRRRVRR